MRATGAISIAAYALIVWLGACAANESGEHGGTDSSAVVSAPAGNGAGGMLAGGTGAATNAPDTAVPTGGASSVPRPPSNVAQGGMGAAAGIGGAAGGMQTAGAGGATDRPPTPRMGETCLQAGDGSYEEQGPYAVGTMDVSIGSSGMYTIFYPEPLESACLHPIVAWGNGTAVTGSAIYAFFNQNAASWGMVVAASHNSNTGSGTFHTDALDYLLAQNADPSSMFHQKLSTRAGVSGHSQGGFGATRGASHANVEAQVSVGASGTSTQKVALLILTGTADLGPDADRAIANAPGSAFVAIWEGGDHVTTETLAGYIARDPGSLQMQRLYAAWFRCFLADDQVACGMFAGGTPDGCGICSDMGWHKLASQNL